MAELVAKFSAYLDALGMPEGWLALEFNDPTFDPTNHAHAPEFVQRCLDTGGKIQPFAWFTRPLTGQASREIVDRHGFRAAIIEAEIPAQRLTASGPVPNEQAQDWHEVAAAFSTFAGDCAVASSWAPFQSYAWSGTSWIIVPDPSIAAPLHSEGWYALPYVYPAENAGITISGMRDYGRHLGWTDSEPVLGCYSGPFGSFRLEDFPERNTCPGYSIWDAGEVLG